uniref:Secreted protein n=1 Tax=Suricata suricatta TaxID=37032 RepID=A0A673VMG9_SURSU
MLGRLLGLCSCELAQTWVPTAGMRGGAGTVGRVWAAEWPQVLDWVPTFKHGTYVGRFRRCLGMHKLSVTQR